MRPWNLAAGAVIVLASLLPILSVNAQDSTRVKASQLVKSVVLINTFACDEQPVPGQAVAVPYQDQRCDASSWKGSGSVIDHQGRILTNDHVIRPDRHGSAVDPNMLGWYLIYQTVDSKELPVALFYARVVTSDNNLDLAVLEPAWTLDGQPIDITTFESAMPMLPIAATGGSVEVEDTLRLLGYPRAHPLVTVSTVNVVGFENDSNVGALGTTAWIRTDVASAGPGNSGGPAVNDAGEQVGVVSAGSRNTLECADYNGDGEVDPVSECQTASGGSEYVRPVPEAYQLLQQENQNQGEVTPTPTQEAPPEPPDESPTPTESGPEPPEEPTEAPTQAAEPSPTPDPNTGEEGGGTAIIIGTLVSADTGDPVARAQIVVLKPGFSVIDWKRQRVGDEAIHSYVVSDSRGNFQLSEPVNREEGYSIWIQARGYEELYKDDKILATSDDPAIVDLGVIKMLRQV